MSHLGRPKEGVFEESESLRPVADWLGSALENLCACGILLTA